MTDWHAIGLAAGIALRGDSARPQSGGSISSAYKVQSDDGPVFVKREAARFADRLAAEADGLAALAEARAVRTPAVLACGEAGSGAAAEAFLIIEWIERSQDRSGNERSAATLGEQLAALHRECGAKFGWHRDNYIGATAQRNEFSDGWIAFLRDQRIEFQLRLAARNGHRLESTRCERLLQGLGEFYQDYEPQPSLLHGDLWGGNWFPDERGAPVIFDPAVYFGDREADLAMTELFGGFGESFYGAYNGAWPLDAGYPARRDLHKLYHVLNHLNLFGGGYLAQARQLLDRLCAELG